MGLENDIVIIDDDPTFRRILSRSLSLLNCDVQHFADPESAMLTIKSQSPITVLLDLKLEADSGLRWIETIRTNNPDGRIILLTGYASISTAVEAIKLGADDYLTKPITAREILKHLQHSIPDTEISINEKPMSVDRVEWEHINKVLRNNNGNISATARDMGMHRRTLQRKLAKKPVRN